MNVGDQLNIGGKTAEVIKVRKTAPVAVVEYEDGSHELHWYGEDADFQPAPRKVARVGGFADDWIRGNILGPISRGPVAEQLEELWGFSSQRTAQDSTGSQREDDPVSPPPLEVDHNGGGVTVCRDCEKSWTGLKPEHCMFCHETFGGTWAGDRHRVGSFTDPGDPRRCLDPIEAGLEQGTRGHWSRPPVWDPEAV